MRSDRLRVPDNLDDAALDRAALIVVAQLPQLGPRRGTALLSSGRPVEVLERLASGKGVCDGVSTRLIEQWAPLARAADLGAALDLCRRNDVAVTHQADDDWPARLVDDPEPPFVLFHRGRLDSLAAPTVAIVGTRRCSQYGRDVAYELGRTLATAGVAVVSGLALGIDAAAHAGTIAIDDGVPVGVVAGGHDHVYPAENRGLWAACSQRGLLVSELPPGSRLARWGFPARNRIIAAFADVVVVVESREKGGSMYTVEEALRRNRPVFAVPGSIHSGASAGTNRLLADGAEPLCSADDVLLALDLQRAEAPTKAVAANPGAQAVPVQSGNDSSGEVPTEQRPLSLFDDVHEVRDGLGAEDHVILGAIGWSGVGFEQLVQRADLPIAVVALGLERLTARGLVIRTGGTIERRMAGPRS